MYNVWRTHNLAINSDAPALNCLHLTSLSSSFPYNVSSPVFPPPLPWWTMMPYKNWLGFSKSAKKTNWRRRRRRLFNEGKNLHIHSTHEVFVWIHLQKDPRLSSHPISSSPACMYMCMCICSSHNKTNTPMKFSNYQHPWPTRTLLFFRGIKSFCNNLKVRRRRKRWEEPGWRDLIEVELAWRILLHVPKTQRSKVAQFACLHADKQTDRKQQQHEENNRRRDRELAFLAFLHSCSARGKSNQSIHPGRRENGRYWSVFWVEEEEEEEQRATPPIRR